MSELGTSSRHSPRELPASAGNVDPGSATVLVVDDEPHLVGMYAAMLEDVCSVRTATSGEAALDRVDDDVDVVLLDRRMPGRSGDDVLADIREEGYDCRVAVVTSVEPDTDVVEQRFDAYVVKPVRQRDLRRLVDDLLLRSQYSDGIQGLFAIGSKLAALDAQFGGTELVAHDAYQTLRDRREQLQASNERQIASLPDGEETALVYRDVLGAVKDR